VGIRGRQRGGGILSLDDPIAQGAEGFDDDDANIGIAVSGRPASREIRPQSSAAGTPSRSAAIARLGALVPGQKFQGLGQGVNLLGRGELGKLHSSLPQGST
jgi:hypothetical protein